LRLKTEVSGGTTYAKADAGNVVTHSAGTAGAIEFNVTAVNGNNVTVSNSLDFGVADGSILLTTDTDTFDLGVSTTETDTFVGIFTNVQSGYAALLANVTNDTVTRGYGFNVTYWKFEIVVPRINDSTTPGSFVWTFE